MNRGDNKIAVGETGNSGEVVFDSLETGTYIVGAYSDALMGVQQIELLADDYLNLNLDNPRSFEHEMTVEDIEGNLLGDVEVYKND